MPRGRRLQMGSFASHFDELVTKLSAEEQRTEPSPRRDTGRKKRPVPRGKVNETLFDAALH